MDHEHERITITLPYGWHAAFCEAARERGLSLSAWIAVVCRRQLPAAERAKLPPPNRPGRPLKNRGA